MCERGPLVGAAVVVMVDRGKLFCFGFFASRKASNVASGTAVTVTSAFLIKHQARSQHSHQDVNHVVAVFCWSISCLAAGE